MNIARLITEAPPSIRWRVGKMVSTVVYRPALARLGARSVIVKPLRLRGTERISIGSDCSIFEGVWLEAEATGRLTLGDRVYLGHDVHLHAVADVSVGDGCMLADGVLVNSGDHAADAVKTVTARGTITIGRDCFIGQRAILLGGVSIGDGAVVGAGAVVTRDVPAGAVVAGVPARELRAAKTVS